MPFSDTLNRAVFQFLAGNFHQDIESPEDALQELLTEENKEYLEEAIIFLTDFINSSYSKNQKNEYIQSCTDGIYFSALDVTPIDWLFQVIRQIEEAVRNNSRGKNN